MHTPGAIRAAQVILNGEETIPTVYGRKSVEGIADLIDRETAARALLAALEAIERIPYSLDDPERCQIGRIARAALALAKGE